MANGRDDEARAFLVRFHGGGDPTHPLIDVQWKEFKQSISINGTDKRWYDYSDLFKTRNLRWRFFMVIMMVCFTLSGRRGRVFI